MGWTWYHCKARKADGTPDVKTECDGLFSKNYRVVKSALVGSTYYAAVESLETGDVIGSVILTSVNTRDYYDFGYKEMVETWGPYRYSCPVSILNLLTPTDDEVANLWRVRCRKHHADHSWFKGLPDRTRVKWRVSGDHFMNLEKGQEVVLVKRRLNPRSRRSKRVWVLEGFGTYLDWGYVSPDDVTVL